MMKSNKNSSLASDIGVRIYEIQKTLKYSDDKMSQILGGIALSSYRRYCSGEVLIPIEKVLILYRDMHVDLNYLLTGDDSKGMFRHYQDLHENLEQMKKEYQLQQKILDRYVAGLPRKQKEAVLRGYLEKVIEYLE